MATGLEAPFGAFRVVGAMRTDVGRVRSSNEDSVAFVAPAADAPEAKSGYLAIVADGMGGHAAGEVASALATEVVRRVFYSLDVEPPRALKAAFDAANRAIFEQSEREPECKGMGTTCTAVVIRDGRLWLAHVGDSRAYIVRRGEVTQLSDDQTLHAQLVRDGVMTQRGGGSQPRRQCHSAGGRNAQGSRADDLVGGLAARGRRRDRFVLRRPLQSRLRGGAGHDHSRARAAGAPAVCWWTPLSRRAGTTIFRSACFASSRSRPARAPIRPRHRRFQSSRTARRRRASSSFDRGIVS